MTAPAAVDDDVQAAVDRLTKQVAELEAELAVLQERNEELRTAADFRATEAAGHVDRSFLEA